VTITSLAITLCGLALLTPCCRATSPKRRWRKLSS